MIVRKMYKLLAHLLKWKNFLNKNTFFIEDAMETITNMVMHLFDQQTPGTMFKNT